MLEYDPHPHAARRLLREQANKLVALAGRFGEIGNDSMARELEDLAENIRKAERELDAATARTGGGHLGKEMDHAGQVLRFLEQAARRPSK